MYGGGVGSVDDGFALSGELPVLVLPTTEWELVCTLAEPSVSSHGLSDVPKATPSGAISTALTGSSPAAAVL